MTISTLFLSLRSCCFATKTFFVNNLINDQDGSYNNSSWQAEMLNTEYALIHKRRCKLHLLLFMMISKWHNFHKWSVRSIEELWVLNLCQTRISEEQNKSCFPADRSSLRANPTCQHGIQGTDLSPADVIVKLGSELLQHYWNIYGEPLCKDKTHMFRWQSCGEQCDPLGWYFLSKALSNCKVKARGPTHT